MSADDGPGTREVAHRVFAAEYDDATLSWAESDEERAPTYVITPSGAKVNRLFLVGVLTEVEDVNEEMLRGRIVDPTGAFVVYAGQYQPDARTFFERVDPPAFVAVTGKARTFQPDDSDRVFTSVRPESVNEVDADTRDRWVVGTAEATLSRVGTMARVLEGEFVPAETTGPALAREHYDTSGAYLSALQDLAVSAAAVVAGDRDEAEPLSADPDAPGQADLDRLAALVDETDLEGATAVEAAAAGEADATSDTGAADAGTATDETDAEAATVEADAGTATEESETGTTAGEESPAAVARADEGTGTGTATTDAADGPEATAGTDEGDDLGEFDADETADEATDEPVGDFDAGDDLGDFEAGDETDGDATETDADDLEGEETAAATNGDADVAGQPDEMYELDEAERREVEEEYGTEFSSGTEVESPGDADLETPEPEADEELEAEPGADEPEPEPGEDEREPEPDEELEAESDEGTEEPEVEADEEEPEPGEADLDEVLMKTMRDLDDGGGADREELIDRVSDATGAAVDDVEGAIQDALMGGQCYEPDDETLKPI